MSQMVLCPQCQKKLSVRDELAGKRLSCPHCKTIFTAPIAEAEPVPAEAAPVEAVTVQNGGGDGLAFLAEVPKTSTPVAAAKPQPSPARTPDLSFLPDSPATAPGPAVAQAGEQPTSGPVDPDFGFLNEAPKVAAKPAPKPVPVAAPKAQPVEQDSSDFGFLNHLPSGGKTTAAAPAPRPAAAAAPTTYAKKKPQQPLGLYIAGGVGGVVVLIVLVVAISSMGGGGGGKGSTTTAGGKKVVPPNPKWGKLEKERRQIFFDLLKAVDLNGPTENCRKAWSAIQRDHNINDDVTAKILDEGLATADWDQPPPGGKAEYRANRRDWVAERTKTPNSDPVLSGRFPAKK